MQNSQSFKQRTCFFLVGMDDAEEDVWVTEQRKKLIDKMFTACEDGELQDIFKRLDKVHANVVYGDTGVKKDKEKMEFRGLKSTGKNTQFQHASVSNMCYHCTKTIIMWPDILMLQIGDHFVLQHVKVCNICINCKRWKNKSP